MIKKICILLFLTGVISFAENIEDKDFDGVPDSLDQCPDTPFFNQVNAQGCTIKKLMLLSDRTTDSLVATYKFSYIANEDEYGVDVQTTNKVRIAYYYSDWSYILRTGYFLHNNLQGQLDTTLKIRKRFKPTGNLRVKLSTSFHFPTRDFFGNNTDITLSSSLNHYAGKKVSFFAGVGHTFVRDKKIITPLQDKSNFYIGVGYFLTKKLYTDFSFDYAQSKFTTKNAIKSLKSAFSYDMNSKYFATLLYSHDILDDEDMHYSFSFTIGYRFW